MSNAERKARRLKARRPAPTFYLGPEDLSPLFVALSVYVMVEPQVKEQPEYAQLVRAFNPSVQRGPEQLQLRQVHMDILRRALAHSYGAAQLALEAGGEHARPVAESSRRLLVRVVRDWGRGSKAAAAQALTDAVAQARETRRRMTA